MEDSVMDEKQPFKATQAEGISIPSGESREQYGDIAVITRKTGARMAWSGDHSEIRVNTVLFPNEDQARITALRQVAGHIGLTQAIRTDANLLLETTRTYPEATEPILRWQGLARIRESNPNILSDQPVALQNQTLGQEFQWALDTYVLTGKYPDQMSDAVHQAIRRIPQPKGRSLVDYIASGRYLKFDGQNFATHLKPLI